MLTTPKLVWPIFNAGNNPQKENSTIFYLKINEKGGLEVLEKKIQGKKFHELKNLKPFIFLDLTKLV